jgi:hypothetical protein
MLPRSVLVLLVPLSDAAIVFVVSIVFTIINYPFSKRLLNSLAMLHLMKFLSANGSFPFIESMPELNAR